MEGGNADDRSVILDGYLQALGDSGLSVGPSGRHCKPAFFVPTHFGANLPDPQVAILDLLQPAGNFDLRRGFSLVGPSGRQLIPEAYFLRCSDFPAWSSCALEGL